MDEVRLELVERFGEEEVINIGALTEEWISEVRNQGLEEDHNREETKCAYDDVLGGELPVDKVMEARQEEIEFMLNWETCEEVPVQQCSDRTGKGPLGGRWVDVNKGDDKNPNVRCRYVAKEVAYERM